MKQIFKNINKQEATFIKSDPNDRLSPSIFQFCLHQLSRSVLREKVTIYVPLSHKICINKINKFMFCKHFYVVYLYKNI